MDKIEKMDSDLFPFSQSIKKILTEKIINCEVIFPEQEVIAIQMNIIANSFEKSYSRITYEINLLEKYLAAVVNRNSVFKSEKLV